MGLALVVAAGAPSSSAAALCFVSPAWSAFFLFFTSLMLLEKRLDARFGGQPEYEAYKWRTSVLLLLPPRGPAAALEARPHPWKTAAAAEPGSPGSRSPGPGSPTRPQPSKPGRTAGRALARVLAIALAGCLLTTVAHPDFKTALVNYAPAVSTALSNAAAATAAAASAAAARAAAAAPARASFVRHGI